jgi:glycerol-3-phosphate acyltransferase PlsX
MGGDHAPHAIVTGAIEAARAYGVTISLVGRPEIIAAELKKHDVSGLDLPIVAASEVIEMHEKPANAVRQKQDSSMVVACKMVRRGEAQAFVTAGNTGGALTAGILHVGRIKGIMRPALVAPFPTLHGVCLILDVGANADVRPEYLQQFALMGTTYARYVMGIAEPTVRILSNGEEEGKGNQLVVTSYKLLAETPGIDFRGNIESKEIPQGVADVVVTDGFTGNIFVKTAEATAKLMQDVIREEAGRDLMGKLGMGLALGAMRRVKERMDDSYYGGAVLLGLTGLLVVAHGRANSMAIRHAIRVAKQAVDQDVLGKIQSGAARMPAIQPEMAAAPAE